MKQLFVAVALIASTTIVPSVANAANPTGVPMHGHKPQHGGGGHSGGDAPTVDGAREIEVTAGRFRFTPNKIAIAPGEDVTIVMTSTDLFHDFVVKGAGHVVDAKRKTTAEGGLRIDEPGTYKVWCSVKGHRAAGMKGTIVVE